MNTPASLGLIATLAVLLAMDLGLFGRRTRSQAPADAVGWTTAWLAVGVGFGFFVYGLYHFNWLGGKWVMTQRLDGREAATQFLAAFFVQKLLCVGAMIMTALIFSHFRLSLAAQRRTLFWAVVGALFWRAAIAAVGIRLIRNQDWAVYFLGGMVIYSAAALVAARHDNRHPRRNPLVRLAIRFFPKQDKHPRSKFFFRDRGRWIMSDAFVALLMCQSVALGFAASAAPGAAIFTKEPFIVAASAACACLGFRSLYYVVAAWLDGLRHFKIALGLSVGGLGIQYLLSPYQRLPIWVTLTWLSLILTAGVLASWHRRDAAPLLSPLADDIEELGEISVSQTRRVVILVMGVSVILMGLVFLLTPLPGVLTILSGFGLLSIEFIWARRWLTALRQRAQRLRRAWFDSDSNTPP